MRSPIQILLFPTSLAILATAPQAMANDKTAKEPLAVLTVTSSAFKADEAIPTEFTCEGADKSPPLAWTKAPADTKSIAILMEDLDHPKGAYTHWLVANIPPTETTLSAGATLPTGSMAAKNDSGSTGYVGPCPPTGKHRYRFHVYALDKTIPERTDMSRADFMKAIKGHVRADGALTAVFEKAGGERPQKLR